MSSLIHTHIYASSLFSDMTNKMLFSGKLILVANTMPLYTLVQLHIQSDTVMNRENEDQQVITKVLQMINHNIATAKDQ